MPFRHDRLAVILQKRREMATLHWACQFAGVVATPLNWRIKAEELDYCLGDAAAAAIMFDESLLLRLAVRWRRADCLPRFDATAALQLVARERITSL